MKATAEVVVIGGGVIGTSLLFSLGRLGVTDTLLVEKDVLGSGSTGRSQTMCRMHYSNPVTAVMAWRSLDIFTHFKEVVGGESGFVETGYLLVVKEEDLPSAGAKSYVDGILVGGVTAAAVRGVLRGGVVGVVDEQVHTGGQFQTGSALVFLQILDIGDVGQGGAAVLGAVPEADDIGDVVDETGDHVGPADVEFQRFDLRDGDAGTDAVVEEVGHGTEGRIHLAQQQSLQ